ncbi:hypothetical protein MY11210_003824 [Beauveria gryllotalpidicola]
MPAALPEPAKGKASRRKYRRALISQNRQEVFITISSYHEAYIDYITNEACGGAVAALSRRGDGGKLCTVYKRREKPKPVTKVEYHVHTIASPPALPPWWTALPAPTSPPRPRPSPPRSALSPSGTRRRLSATAPTARPSGCHDPLLVTYE